MSYTAKDSLIGFWILIVIAVILWYRNYHYDRLFAILILLFSLTQFIEYGIHSGSKSSALGALVFIILLLELLVMSIGVYTYLNNTISLIIMIVIILIFIIMTLYALVGSSDFRASMPESHEGIRSDRISWKDGLNSLLGSFSWVYIVGFVILFILLMCLQKYH